MPYESLRFLVYQNTALFSTFLLRPSVRPSVTGVTSRDVEEVRHQQEQQQNGSQMDNRVAVHPRRRHQLSAIEKTTLFGRFFKNVVKCDSHFHCPETHI